MSLAPVRWRMWLAHGALACVVTAGCVLRRWPPDQSTWYPSCLVYRYLHVLCPGCGATHALAALLRGDVAGAVHANLLFVLLLPCVLVLGGISYVRAVRLDEFRWPEVPRSVAYATCAVACAFAVIRNLA